ncbi:MFS transporter [Streptomyces sp. NBC_00102]|uniref:MFS transporter n=1 Tax=Streptomyces sp. NBC_00102 TaxID=2975652 RepID=UPI00224C98C3|nr:MFS transporter [Streptomyces sp. NBC_00102]MCX5400909.1 MFS transporter [Streptomyces sp. NBC_00102]
MPTPGTDALSPPAGVAPVRSGASPGLRLTALAAGFVMATLDVTVVNVAGPAVQEDLHASLSELTWIVDGYVLVFGSLLLLGGGLANRLGAKKVYLWGMAVFFVASLGCALAPDAASLVVARLVQGVGAALFMPSSLSLLVLSFPGKRERTRMLGLWSAIVATSAGLGPSVGGLLVGAFGWRSIFLLNLPVGIAGILLTVRFVTATEVRPVRLAVPGHVLWIAALAALSFALIEGPRLGWAAGALLVSYAVLAVSGGALVARERRATHPVMPWSLFRRAGFSGANLVGFLFNFGLYGGMFMFALYLQRSRGDGPLRAGLEMLPMTVCIPMANLVYARVSARFSNGALLTLCLLVAGAASASMSEVSASTPYWVVALGVGVANLGAGIVSPGMTAALVDSAGPENANVAGSVLNANRQIGTLVGVAVMSVVLAAVPDWDRGPGVCFLLVGVAYIAAAACAWQLITRSERREAATV